MIPVFFLIYCFLIYYILLSPHSLYSVSDLFYYSPYKRLYNIDNKYIIDLVYILLNISHKCQYITISLVWSHFIQTGILIDLPMFMSLFRDESKNKTVTEEQEQSEYLTYKYNIFF